MVTLVRNENETDQKTQYFTRILQRICARVEKAVLMGKKAFIIISLK